MAKKRIIDVQKQRNLSLSKTFSMCWKAILHRLLRSVLTLAVVVLAVAFFMFLLSESALVFSTARGVEAQQIERRTAAQFLNQFCELPQLPALREQLTAAAGDPARQEVLARFSGLTSAALQTLAAEAAVEARYLQFYREVPAGNKAILFGRLHERALFAHLLEPEAWDTFEQRIKPMLDLEVPGGLPAFRGFLEGYADYLARLGAYQQVWQTAVQRLLAASAKLQGELPLDVWLAKATPEALESWRTVATRNGVELSAGQALTIQGQLQEITLRQQIRTTLNTQAVRDAWRKAFRERIPSSTESKMSRLDESGVAPLLDNRYPPDQLAAIAARIRHDNKLSAIAANLAGKVDLSTNSALSTRQLFLLLISFVVCMAGISNAMLMSITERFREIATMKCLGATDRYILVQFMIEAGLQGICGGLLGMLLGALTAMLKNGMSFGAQMFSQFPVVVLISSAGISITAGVLLAILASIYPSWAASRMAPMEAMRIE